MNTLQLSVLALAGAVAWIVWKIQGNSVGGLSVTGASVAVNNVNQFQPIVAYQWKLSRAIIQNLSHPQDVLLLEYGKFYDRIPWRPTVYNTGPISTGGTRFVWDYSMLFDWIQERKWEVPTEEQWNDAWAPVTLTAEQQAQGIGVIHVPDFLLSPI